MSVVINRSEATTLGSQRRRQPSPLKQEQRKYDDGPLPIKASDHAPLKARIVNRVFEGGVVTFELKIGDTVMNGIGLEEVLDYVSPYHLEEYENEAFKVEEEMLRIADEEDQRLREEERERRKQRAKNKGVAFIEDTSMSDDSQEDATEYDAANGRNGRPRPSYKKDLLKVRQRRRRRKRDKATGELLPRSDDEEVIPRRQVKQEDQDDQDSSSDDRSDRKRNPFSMDNLPIRRRRRKRDPITKELLPLDSTDGHQPTPKTNESHAKDTGSGSALQAMATAFFEKPKRPRRKRHPRTNELMPLGWNYDSEAEKQQRQAGVKVPSIQRLSLSNENEPKRRRLERNMSSSGASATPHKPGHDMKAPTKAALMAFKQGDAINVDSDSAEDEIQVTPAGPKPKLLRRSVGGAAVNKPASSDDRARQSLSAVLPVHASQKKPAQSREPSSGSNSSIIPLQVDDGDSSSEEEEEEEEITAPRTGSSKAHIPHRSAAAKEPSSAAESDDDELPADEYVVQAILAHGLSKPIELPNHVGKKAVMLYKVKWEGWGDPTWEPLSSFDGAMDAVREYQDKVKMKESDRNT
jgi:hypothetical protein